MSHAEIIRELPRLSETERRAIREALLRIANNDPEDAICNEIPPRGESTVARMQDGDNAGL